MKSKIAKLGFLAALAGVTLLAQNTAGVGSISGTVQDAAGGVVPGARVVVDNTAKGIHREAVTSGSGVFSAPSLAPAPGYSVTITRDGFATYTVGNIEVFVGQTVNLAPVLTVSSAASRVEVTAEAPLVESTKTDVSQVVTSQQIMDLPINGRRVDSFVLLTPGVTTDGSFGLISFRGNPGGNSFLTDGNDTTNQFYDENAGRTRTTNIAQDAVQEFQVVSSNFLAEYGRASGGVVNTVTRSGSNTVHGTAYWFFRNRTLNATDMTAHGVNQPEWRHQAGASIGGPIRANKLFYFFNGELQRRNFPMVSSNLTNSSIFDANGNYLPVNPSTKKPNCDTTVASADQCQAAIGYLQGRDRLQLVPRTADTNLLFGKIDYHVNDSNTLSFSANYLDFRSPNGIQTQLSLTNGDALGNNANTNVFNRTARAAWTSVVTPAAVNELRFGYFKDRQYDPASPSLLPAIGLASLTVQGNGNVGYANGYPRLNPSEQRVQLADTLSRVAGPHNLKFGVDAAHVDDYVSRLANRYGTYSYATLTNFALDFSDNAAGGRHYNAYSQVFGNPVVETKLNEFAVFVQDEWHVTPKLTFSPGLRYEHTWIPQPKIANPAFPQTAHIPSTDRNLAPRVGVAYAFNEKTVFRGGFGLFFNRYTSSTIENFFLTNGIYQSSYSFNTPAQLASGPVFPRALSAAPSFSVAPPSIFAPSPTFRNPYSEQADIAIERQIAKNTSLTVSYVFSRGLHLLQTQDLNTAAPTTSYTFPILDASGNIAGNYTSPIYTARVDPAYKAGVYQADSAGNSYYNGLLVQVTRRYSDWLQGNVAYTYSHAIDDNQGGGGNTLFGSTFPTSVFNGDYRGEKGSSSIDQRHRLVVNAIVAPTFTHSTSAAARYLVNNWQLSVVSLAASSQPLAPTIRVQDRVPGALSFFSLNGLGGSGRVPFEPTSLLNIGDVYRTDARIAKLLPISERVKVYLQFEAFNVFNHPIAGGPSPRVTQQYTAIKQTAGPASGLIALVPNPSYGALLQTQAPPDGTTARRAQASLRIVF